MTQPFGEEIPQELYQLAQEFGVPREEIERVHEIIQLTPEIPVRAIAANGQPLGDGVIRAAREYDHQASAEDEGKTLVVVEAPDAGVQFAFLVDRLDLATQLTVEIPDVPSTSGQAQA